MIKSKALYINLFLTFVAICLHGYLAHKHFLIQTAQATGESMCNLGGRWNCDAVNTSPYAQFLGFPLAAWGLATNLLFLVCQGMVAARQEAKGYWADLSIYFSIVIALASVVMGVITTTQIGAFCLFCISAYVLSFLSLVILPVAGLSFKQAFQNIGDVALDKTTWGFLIAIPLLTVFANAALSGGQDTSRMKSMVQDQVNAWKAAPEQVFDSTLGLHAGAPIDQAKMTIVEFADFRCPHCKHAAPSVKAFVQSRTDVALLFKPYPLDGTCNLDPAFKGQGDGISCRLALAVVCAEQLEKKGWDLFYHIFDKQMEYGGQTSVADTDKMLCESGITKDCAAFAACMDNETTRNSITQMAKEGTTAGVRGTPSFYVNKKSLQGAQFVPVLEKTYAEIKGQSN